MDGSVTLAHVVEAYEARQRAFVEFERQHAFRQRQDLEVVKSSLSPVLYDQDLGRLKTRRVIRSGDWLSDEGDYNRWVDPLNETSRLLWLIPGAGMLYPRSDAVRAYRH